MTLRRLGITLACVLLASPAWATTYYVSTSGNNANSCGTATSGGSSAKRNVKDGVACATTAGDTVTIAAGTYTDTTRPHRLAGLPVQQRHEHGLYGRRLVLMDRRHHHQGDDGGHRHPEAAGRQRVHSLLLDHDRVRPRSRHHLRQVE
jgi:hypothetical protein